MEWKMHKQLKCTVRYRVAPLLVHDVSKKFPPLNNVTLSILTEIQNFCTAGKHMKFATKSIRHYSSHLRHVATLPWEINNSQFSSHGRICKQIAF